MDLVKLDTLLRNSPTLKLLRTRQAALMITFFHQQFKERNEIAVPNSLLVQRLADFLDLLDYHDEEENSDLAYWSLDYSSPLTGMYTRQYSHVPKIAKQLVTPKPTLNTLFEIY